MLLLLVRRSNTQTFGLIPRKELTRRISTDEIIFERSKCVGLIKLNRPKHLNALNHQMCTSLFDKLKEWKSDKSVSMIVIKSAGDKMFCAGGDIKSFRKSFADGNDRAAFSAMKTQFQINYLISELKKPYVALINGVTMGGGAGLSIHDTHIIATENTIFAMPETAIGLFPDVGMTHVLSRLPGKLGLYLGLTGHRLKGKELFNVGLATHFMQSSQLDQITNDLLQIANQQDLDQVLTKYSTEKKDEYPLDQINRTFRGESIEEIFKNLEKDNSEWSQKQLATLHKMSPTSLKVTFKYMHKAASLTLAQVLQTDYNLARNIMLTGDIFEGVRALLIDKDFEPNWKPSNIQNVNDNQVDEFFLKRIGLDELDFVDI